MTGEHGPHCCDRRAWVTLTPLVKDLGCRVHMEQDEIPVPQNDTFLLSACRVLQPDSCVILSPQGKNLVRYESVRQ